MLIFTSLLVFVAIACQLGAYFQQNGDPSNPEPTGTTSPTITPTPPVLAPPPALGSTPTPSEELMGIEFRRLNDLSMVVGMRAEWFRWNAIIWHRIETEEGIRDWSVLSDLETQLITASEQGVRPILVVRGAPEWAQKIPGSFCGPIQEDKLPTFVSFVAEAVTRYSAPPFNVKYWEFGNEPDVDAAFVQPDSVFGCWGDPNDPDYGGGYYGEMLKQVYPVIKSIDPEAQVLVGGLLLDCDPGHPPETAPGSGVLKDCTPARFLEGILKNGGGSYFDGVSYHAYDYYAAALGNYLNGNWRSSWDTTGPTLIAKARYIRGLLENYGFFDKYLINSELALLCGRDGKEDFCQTGDFNLTKAYFLAEAYGAARAEGLRSNIWFSLRGWRGSGLVDEQLQPNPAYQAFDFQASKLEDTAFVGEITGLPGIQGYQFANERQRIALVWALDEESHPVMLQELPEAMYDVFGNPIQANNQQIEVTLAPVYIQWGP